MDLDAAFDEQKFLILKFRAILFLEKVFKP